MLPGTNQFVKSKDSYPIGWLPVIPLMSETYAAEHLHKIVHNACSIMVVMSLFWNTAYFYKDYIDADLPILGSKNVFSQQKIYDSKRHTKYQVSTTKTVAD